MKEVRVVIPAEVGLLELLKGGWAMGGLGRRGRGIGGVQDGSMGDGDRAVVVGKAVAVVGLMNSSQFGILSVAYAGILVVVSLGEAGVVVLLFTTEFKLLRLRGDELQDASGRRRQLIVADVFSSNSSPRTSIFPLPLSLIKLQGGAFPLATFNTFAAP